jgi:RimJ/RimL family protein N-acetyltransferase
MDEIKTIEIRKLKLDDVPDLIKRLSEESLLYLKHFTAFELSDKSLTTILTRAVKDKYFGMFFGDEIVGFYMLRGFDEGFEVPSYGVIILSKFSNKGLSRLTLYHAFSLCRLNNIKKLMLKVRPENKHAKNLYESLGFKKTGFDSENGNFIYHKSLPS